MRIVVGMAPKNESTLFEQKTMEKDGYENEPMFTEDPWGMTDSDYRVIRNKARDNDKTR